MGWEIYLKHGLLQKIAGDLTQTAAIHKHKSPSGGGKNRHTLAGAESIA